LGNELAIELFVVDLILADGVVDHKRQEKLSYEAPSHHWEDLTNNSAVIVNSLSYPITQNLYVALQRLRSPNQHHYRWIDTLCLTLLFPPVYPELGHQILITMVQDSVMMVWNLVTTCRSLATMVANLITR
jgi:hypothetical protein